MMAAEVWIWRDLERGSHGLTKVLTGIHLDGLRESMKILVRMAMYQLLNASYILLEILLEHNSMFYFEGARQIIT
jgi:hypothetical protein